MQRSALLVLLACAAGIAVHSACAESVEVPRKIGAVDKKPKAPTSCGDNKEKHDCLDIGAQEGDCAWCVGDYMPASCMSAMAAKYLPETVAKCKLPKKHKTSEATAVKAADSNKKKPKAPTSCGDNKEKHDCLDIGAQEGDCAWCAGGYMPASCMSAMAAKYLPEMVAKCRLPKKHKFQSAGTPDAPSDPDKPKPKAPASCGDNTDKESCLEVGAQEGDCAWCKGGSGSSMPASCVGVEAARWIPEQVAHCKLPKKHKDDDEDDDCAEQLLEKKHKKDDSGSGGNWPSGGGDWPSGGGDWPGPSGGGGQGQGCMNIKSKHKCLKGTDSGACAWCKNSYMGSKCVDEMTVKYMPKFIADCKMGKEKKKKGVVEMS